MESIPWARIALLADHERRFGPWGITGIVGFACPFTYVLFSYQSPRILFTVARGLEQLLEPDIHRVDPESGSTLSWLV